MLTLYLVSALQTDADIAKRGVEGRDGRYWKVGVTTHSDPLKRDPGRYQEAFRALRFNDATAKVLETAIARVFRAIGAVHGVREGLQYAYGLECAERIYDFFVQELSANPKKQSAFLSLFPFGEPSRVEPIDYRIKKAEALIHSERWSIKESKEDAGKSAFARTFHKLRLHRFKTHPTDAALRWDRYFTLIESVEPPALATPAAATPMW